MLSRSTSRLGSALSAVPRIACNVSIRLRSTTAGSDEPREAMQYDCVIVGGGPAGMSAAIRLKQKALEAGKELSVCVVEKASQVGAHTLSGACIETRALSELIPDWEEREAPLQTKVTEDHFCFLTKSLAIPLPVPPTMHNEGNYIVSLGQVVRWLGSRAEELGVEIYPGFAASELLYNEDGSVKGIATNDVGIARDGTRKDSFARGIELHAKHTLLAEGCRGSLSKQLMAKFDLNKDSQSQTYGLGIKEVWEVDPKYFRKGYVMHTIGWPVDYKTYGGSWMYHFGDNRISVGFVTGLDYQNPYMSPYQEFQRFKTHPHIRKFFENGKRIAYGARTLVEGGLQSIPKLVAPGASLIGDAAGFLNVPKVKGTHCAMKSGILAADSLYEKLCPADETVEVPSNGLILDSYPESFKNSWLHDELHSVRNVRPAFKYGMYVGIALSALDAYVFRGNAPWTFSHCGADHLRLKSKDEVTPIEYPKPDGKISFDILTSVALSGTNHEHDQPIHLRLKDQSVPNAVNLPKFDGPEGRYCPARVYEYVEDATGGKKLQINSQNCLHCKACDIKDPTQNINWTVPEGGGGPAYEEM